MTDYDSPAPTQTQTQENTTLGCYMSYVKSLPGILKIVEIVLSLVTFICASVNPVWVLPEWGGGFVQFTAIMAVIISSALFLFRVSNLISKIPGPIPFIEFVYYIVFSLCYLISGILAAVRANRPGVNPWRTTHPDTGTVIYSADSIIAASIFSFLCLILFGVGTFFAFKQWRSGNVSRPPPRQEAPAQEEMGADAHDDFSKY